MVKFREMKPEEMKLVLSLGLANMPDSRGFATHMDDYKKLDKDTYKFYVAHEDDQIVGHIAFSVTPDFADILFLFVVSEHRQKGIASFMLQTFDKLLEHNGVKKIMLEVRKGNILGQRTYVTNGFLVQDIRKGYYDNGEDAYVMTKKVGKTYATVSSRDVV